MKLIRVLQIIDNISIDSGVSSAVMNFYRKIDKSKIQFDFLVARRELNRGKSYEEEIKDLGGRVTYFGNSLSIREHFSAVARCKKYFLENMGEYQMVHLHTPTIAKFTLKYAKKYGIDVRIVHSHSTMTSLNKLKAIINKYLIMQIKKYATDFWGCSTEACEFLYGKKWCKNNGVIILKNAIDTTLFKYDLKVREDLRTKLNVENKRVVLHVSNFSPIKNHLFLIPVIKHVKERINDIVFIFVGDGPTKEVFEKELDNKGVSELCIFTGRKDNVKDYMSMADLLILPSIKEGAPVTVLEAQATGLKCMISDTITSEVTVTNVSRVMLNEKNWSKELVNFLVDDNKIRMNNAVNFQNSSFNIDKEVRRLEKLYYKISVGDLQNE